MYLQILNLQRFFSWFFDTIQCLSSCLSENNPISTASLQSNLSCTIFIITFARQRVPIVWRIKLLICLITGTIYQEVISYNNTNDTPPVVEGNGEINASSSSSSISSGNVTFFERDSKQGFSSGGMKKRVRFGSDRVVTVPNLPRFRYTAIRLHFAKLYCLNARNMLILWKTKCLDAAGQVTQKERSALF